MKILIIGSNGMLGKDLKTVLAPYEPIGVDRAEMDLFLQSGGLGDVL